MGLERKQEILSKLKDKGCGGEYQRTGPKPDAVFTDDHLWDPGSPSWQSTDSFSGVTTTRRPFLKECCYRDQASVELEG